MTRSNFKKSILVSISALSLGVGAAHAQVDATDDVITVIGDPVGLLEERETDSVFGVNRALVETPRSISIVSDTTMDRYAIEDIDDFITTTPGTFGGSYFGVPGAVSIRGDLGDNYFRGFKRSNNPGTYPLPVGASSRVEIVRGPTPAIYGAGRIGGFLNFYPKTAAGEGVTADDGVSGSISYTGGSFDKNVVTGEVVLPFLVGGRETGLAAYVEYEDSEDFVRGREPQSELFQLGFNHDAGNGFSIELGGYYHNVEGFQQTAGINRLTQDFIDNGVYITGRDINLVDTDGNGRITQNEADAQAGDWFDGVVSCLSAFTEFVSFSPFSCGSGPFTGAPGDVFDLDVGVGTTTDISLRDQLISDFDVGTAENLIVYGDLIKQFDNGSVAKLQIYYDSADVENGTAHGFAAAHDIEVLEFRGSYEFDFEYSDFVEVDVFANVNHRRYDSVLFEYFQSGYVVVDRVDLSVGPQGNDIFDTPFTDEGAINAPWDNINDSFWTNTGVAVVTDIMLWEKLGILFNGRFDKYDYRGIDRGITSFGDPQNVIGEGDETQFSWTISGSYDIAEDLGVDGSIVPYFTYANVFDPLINPAGGFSIGTILDDRGSVLSDSEGMEAGIKFELLDDRLFGSLAVFEQEETTLDVLGNALREESRGFEAELNWLVTDNWVVTAASTVSEFNVKDPDPDNCAGGFSGKGEFVNIQPIDPSIGFDFDFDTVPNPIPSNIEGYGGIFRVLNASCLPELQDGYEKEGIPNHVHSLFLTYTSPETDYGTFGATFGGTYVGESGTLPVANEVRFPDYIVFRLAAFAEFGPLSLIGTIDNLTDKRYFTSLQGTFQNVTVSPGESRTWRLTARYSF
ncbi:MAG: TonB-dependent receptor [Pseudomonadota bacterium]